MSRSVSRRMTPSRNSGMPPRICGESSATAPKSSRTSCAVLARPGCSRGADRRGRRRRRRSSGSRRARGASPGPSVSTPAASSAMAVSETFFPSANVGDQHAPRRELADGSGNDDSRVALEVLRDPLDVVGLEREVELLPEELLDLVVVGVEPLHRDEPLDDRHDAADRLADRAARSRRCRGAAPSRRRACRSSGAPRGPGRATRSRSAPAGSSPKSSAIGAELGARCATAISSKGRGGTWSCSPSSWLRNSSGRKFAMMDRSWPTLMKSPWSARIVSSTRRALRLCTAVDARLVVRVAEDAFEREASHGS